jgi:hypothetical protein
MPRPLALVLLAALLTTACSSPDGDRAALADRPEADALPYLRSLAEDALRAAAEIKVRGAADAVLEERPLAPMYEAALRPHFALMQRLHGVSREAGIRYTRTEIELQPVQFCAEAPGARMLVQVGVRYDMEGIEPNAQVPPYTASTEEHVFHFVRDQDEWRVAHHHFITLAELHDGDRLRQLRRQCP